MYVSSGGCGYENCRQMSIFDEINRIFLLLSNVGLFTEWVYIDVAIEH